MAKRFFVEELEQRIAPKVLSHLFGMVGCQDSDPVTSLALGEESDAGYTSLAVGEEDGGATYDATTFAVGEEDGSWDATTFALGEEDGSWDAWTDPGDVTTFALGEEG
ncbi:MAG: hypothetical protein HYY16_18885 [Planctomycetes bacterium]|nr:hypothetical protein [Planctomycetota bacterium]